VRLLTIHGSKGWNRDRLGARRQRSHAATATRLLAPWPPDAPQPVHFSLVRASRATAAQCEKAWFLEEAALAQRESDNLLYVALTRARQALFVSGDANKNAWLARVDAAWQLLGVPADLPTAAAEASGAATTPARIDARLWDSASLPKPRSGGGERRALSRLPGNPCAARVPRDLAGLAARLGLQGELEATAAAARALLARPHLARFFDPRSTGAPTMNGRCWMPAGAMQRARSCGGIRRRDMADRLQDRR